jgi:sialate O-acetylesterase
MLSHFLLLCLALLLSLANAAPFRLASIFGPGMVLQRDAPVTVWGWATPGTSVYAYLVNAATNATLQASGVADGTGLWSVKFPAQPASGFDSRLFAATSDIDIGRCLTYQFYCSGASLSVPGIAFGDVVQCIGQSNSAWRSAVAARCSADAHAHLLRQQSTLSQTLALLPPTPHHSQCK